MFSNTRKLFDGRFTAVVTGDRDGRYPIASALPVRDRNQSAILAVSLISQISRVDTVNAQRVEWNTMQQSQNARDGWL